MAELKTDAQHGSLWSNYDSPVQMSGRFNSIDAAVSNPTTASPHLGRPRSSNPGMDYHPPYHYSRHSQDEGDAYDRQQQQHQSLQPHHSYPNLKRPYSHTEQPPYQEIVQDLRDDGNKLSVNHDHKLLSFRKTQDKHTILDQHGRIHQLELSAQLHGMFFLSEMPANTTDGSVLQPELTCYRRNLFQISGSLITPRSPLSVVTETGETVAVSSTEVTVSAIESVDGHPVRLIVIPWKTPPPNTPEVAQGPDQEPASLPLIPFQDDGSEAEGEYAVYPIGWRRLQFRIATANNGRRKELQQHFVLHLKVMGTLANGSKVVLTEATTAPIVVRGRSPRNFQARKEIPLLGSSAGSRGQALVETGLGIVAGPLTAKPQEAKPRPVDMNLPRTAFTFNGPKQMPQSPMGMRSNTYPQSWNGPNQMPLSHIPSSGPAYPASSLPADPYHKVPLSGAPSYSTEPQDMPLQTTMPSVQLTLAAQDQHQQQPPIRTQYATYVQGSSAPAPQLSLSTTADSSLSVPRYMDHASNRPIKSPRHASHQSVHSTGSSVPSDPTSSEYRYGPGAYGGVSSTPTEISPQGTHPAPGSYGAASGGAAQQQQQHQQESGSAPSSATTAAPPPRDYFPSAQSWTTTAGEAPSSSVSYTNGEHNRYAYPYQEKSGGGHAKTDTPHHHQGQHQHQQQGQAAQQGYGGQVHYQWNTT
ncbi:NDT80/PhoG like DNA-binding family protein [Coniochaeta sp. 2T2.1]|nr:NDT80/PhoG like DNA-binding family protein [Coniochaeta sp. 2T2.1]